MTQGLYEIRSSSFGSFTFDNASHGVGNQFRQ
jgi:hypothetical protein